MHLHINGKLTVDSEASDVALTLTFIKTDFTDAEI